LLFDVIFNCPINYFCYSGGENNTYFNDFEQFHKHYINKTIVYGGFSLVIFIIFFVSYKEYGLFVIHEFNRYIE